MRIHSIADTNTPFQASLGLDVLGTISEGRTFRVSKARRGSKFVILKTPVSADSMSLEMLRREYELGKGLSHHCIVETLAFEEDTPIGPAIVLEFIEGRTLDEFIDAGASFKQRRSILTDILEGVDYLHHRGLFHNDLKPDNIIISGNGSAHIIDFGFSASADSTFTGCIGGTEGYTAPELIAGKGTAGASSDIYSIGQLIRLLFNDRRYRVITRKCTRDIPEERYQSATELRKAVSLRDSAPWISAAIAIITLLIVLTASPLIKSRTEHVKVYKSENDLEEILAPEFRRVSKLMESQTYQEFAMLIKQKYDALYFRKLDSLNKAHPVSATGEADPELYAIINIYSRHTSHLDSIAASLPSIKILPTKEQAVLIDMLNSGLIPESD